MRDVILWGGTGQAKVLHECLLGTDHRIVAVFDNMNVPPPFSDVPFHVGEAGFRSWMAERRSGNGSVLLGGRGRMRSASAA